MSAGARRGGYGHASKVDRDAATKHTTVDFVSKDADEQVVTGVVMVPFEVDRQGDYETPDTIRQFADDFADLYDNGSADGGIMHAAWPSDWMALEANVIAGRDPLPDAVADADLDDGTWVQQWKISDDGLWNLIDDEIFQGFSIGARDVEWRGPMEQSELPEGVGVPDEYGEDDPVWELVDGITREVSTVDTPAVPEALVLAKDEADKALEEYLGDRDGFIAEMQQRGHDEAAAERVWDVMSRAADVEGSDSPGKDSLYERIGKAAASVLPGASAPAGTDDAAGAEHQTRPDTAKRGPALAKDWGADAYWVRAGDDPMDGQEPGDLLGIAVDMPEGDVFIDWKRDAFPDPLDDPHISVYGSIDDLMTATSNTIEPAGSFISETNDTEAARAAKEGRTLSRANQQAAMAAIDANLDLLRDAGADPGMTRFTDRDDTDFDLAEYAPRTWGDDAGEGDGEEEEDDTTENMSNDNDDTNDDVLAEVKALREDMAELKSDPEGDGPDDGKDANKDDDPDGELTEAVKDLTEEVESLKATAEENSEAIDSISKQAGYSTQVTSEKGADGGEGGDESGLDEIKAALS